MLDKINGLRPRQQRRATRHDLRNGYVPTEDGDGEQLSPAASDYVTQIAGEWRKIVPSIIGTGRLLIKAKSELPHGVFGKMFDAKKLPFSWRTAQRLMAIAEHPVLSNATHVSHLPASWGTLYRLTDIPEDELERMLADGTINANTERDDVDVIIKLIRESGLYNYAKLRAALNLLIGFMHKYQKLDDLGCVLNEENVERIYVDLPELSKLPAWIKKLHAAAGGTRQPRRHRGRHSIRNSTMKPHTNAGGGDA